MKGNMSFVGFSVIFLVALTFAIVAIDYVSDTAEEMDSITLTDSDSFVYTAPATLSPSGEGVTTTTVQSPNSSWLDFDGVNDYLQPINQSFMNTRNGSVCLWYKLVGEDALHHTQTFFRADKDISTIIGAFNRSLNTFSFVKGSPSTQVSGINPNVSYEYSSTGFNHVCLTWKYLNQTASEMDGYLNGEYVANSQRNFSGATSNSSTIFIGGWSGTANLINGSVDDVKIYNKYLSLIDINEVYLQRRGINLSIPVLYYHALCPHVASYGLCINASELTNQLSYMNSSGYRTITDVEYYNWTQDWGFSMPEKPVMIQWDDGWNGTLDAAEIMANYSYKGVLAVNTMWIENPSFHTPSDFMNWSDIVNLVNVYNWSLASHSDGNAVYGNYSTTTKFASDSERSGNFSSSKARLIERTNVTPISFVFPSNDFGQYNNITLHYPFANIPYPNIMTLCSANYTLCWGYSFGISNPHYINKKSGHYDGTLYRISMPINDGSYLTIGNVFESYGVDDSKVMDLKFEENNGTIAYDSSGNGNNGTISGATWRNDTIWRILTPGIDYHIASNNILDMDNSEYLYSWIDLDYSYTSETAEGARNGAVLKIAAILIAAGLLFMLYKYIQEQFGGFSR